MTFINDYKLFRRFFHDLFRGFSDSPVIVPHHLMKRKIRNFLQIGDHNGDLQFPQIVQSQGIDEPCGDQQTVQSGSRMGKFFRVAYGRVIQQTDFALAGLEILDADPGPDAHGAVPQRCGRKLFIGNPDPERFSRVPLFPFRDEGADSLTAVDQTDRKSVV